MNPMRIPLLILAGVLAVSSSAVEQWGCFEATLEGPGAGNPYVEVQMSATFSQGAQRFTVPGFWDGGSAFKVRFMPPSPGEWRYATTSNRPELDGQTGSFLAAGPSRGNHGPVRVAATWHFAYADGTPYFQVGTTCYAWVHQTDEMQQQTLKTLARSPFNKIRFCLFPKSYAYNRNDPPTYAFARRGDGTFDFTRPDPVFWRHFEQRILDLQQLGIEADVILWHPYDRWGFAQMGAEHDDRYLRYAIARLAAFRNVWWSLANEYDLMAPRTTAQGHRGDKTLEDWNRFFAILEKEDPFHHLRSIHNCRGFYDHTRAWVTHASIQRHDLPTVFAWREQFHKPIVVDECGYEGNIPQGWGNLTAQELTRRFWIGAMRGGYVGHGETYQHPEDILWWSKGGVLHGQSPPRLAFFKEILSQVAFQEFTPQAEPTPGNYLLSKEGEAYFLYFTRPAKTALQLAGNRPYKLDGIDTWAMTVTPLGTAPPGEFSFTPPQAGYLVRLTAYQPGEPRRPQVNTSASPTEGTAPLTVRFVVENPGEVRWDFGDGATSAERRPSHTYRVPGQYTATVTVTGDGGAQSARFLTILADRNVSEPIVRAGFAARESHPLKLHGQVKRGEDGSFILSDGEPWGWVAVSEAPIADLENLRSFTICGWVKPASLTAGSGGNRIACHLQYDRDGSDLVHLADGRLRLAVNEWPDRCTNDSSPGKLRVGRWVFFALTYDATRQDKNVHFYFGDEDTPAELDRVNTYSRGPTGTGTGPLTIGNYNPPLHRHGLDRQFRGQIRWLQIFGSTVSSRGALSLREVRAVQAGR